MGFLIVLLILILGWQLFGGQIMRLISRWLSGKYEDGIRRMMGMPTRKEERRQRKRAAKENRGSARSSSASRNQESRPHPAKMMKNVAVDVEYTEIKEFEERTIIETDNNSTRIRVEEQISDVEYVEIKNSTRD